MPIIGQWTNPALQRCRGKRRYANWVIAEEWAEAASNRTGELIIAYKCYDCGRYHIGHADLAQRVVRSSAASLDSTPENTRAPLPLSCPQCNEDIPDERRKAAECSGSPTVYCSQACKRRAADSRRPREAETSRSGGREEAD